MNTDQWSQLENPEIDPTTYTNILNNNKTKKAPQINEKR